MFFFHDKFLDEIFSSSHHKTNFIIFFFKLQEGLNKEVKGDENVNNRLTKKR
mgnify:CR=1 FL=1